MKKIICIILTVLIVINITLLGFNLYNIKEISNKVKANENKLILNGDAYVKIGINRDYKEEGAKVVINKKESDALVDGNVDSSKLGKYIIRYYSKDLKNYNLYRIIEIEDTEKPAIKLKGSDNINIYVGEKYNEPGFEVSDNSKEDLSGKVKIEGEVKNKKVGKYTLTYKVADSSGNESEAKRTINVKNRPIVTTRAVTKTNKVEKGTTVTKNVDLNKNSNTTVSMNFTNEGFHIDGYVKNGNGNYTLKLCASSCNETKMSANKTNYYSGNVNLTNLSNGTYSMKIVSDNEMDVINELSNDERIVRAKVGNKLATFSYSNNRPTVKIENFAYEYDILIDAGHGGSDTGATNSKTTEKALNLEQSLYEKQRYEQHGLKVKMIRTNDSYGLMMGDSKQNVHRRGYAMGYYGVVSKYVYSNHHNSIGNDYYSGWEIILANRGRTSDYGVAYRIADAWKNNYPTNENHMRIYGRNYDSNALLNKSSGQVYYIKDYYAVIRIPYQLFNVYTTIYEGCYLSNMDDYDWYSKNWKKMSEIKIKAYVESLGKSYIPN